LVDLDNEKLVQSLSSLDEKSIYLLDFFGFNQQSLGACDTREARSPLVKAKRPGPDEQRLERALELYSYQLEIKHNVRTVKSSQFIEMSNQTNENQIIIDDAYIENIDKTLANSLNRLGRECFISRLPEDVFEDELLELFEPFGPILDLQLYIDPHTGSSRGFAFVFFPSREKAQAAINQLNNHEIRPTWYLTATFSVHQSTLFVGNLPKKIVNRQQLTDYFGKLFRKILFSLFHCVRPIDRIL
jgi:RNA recognition motif-containing protein